MRSNRFALFTQSSLGAIHAFSFHSNALLYRRCRRLFSCHFFKCPGHTQRASCCCGLFIDEVFVFFFFLGDPVCSHGSFFFRYLLVPTLVATVSVFFVNRRSYQRLCICILLLWQLVSILSTPIASLTDTHYSRAALHPQSSLQPDRSSSLIGNIPRSLA